MPKESLNIYLTAVDNMSPALASITDKTKALDKESQALQQTTNALAKANQRLMSKQSKLQSETSAAAKTVKELQKAYDKYGDEMMRLDLDQAIENHAKLKNELMLVTEQINANTRAYKENIETIRKGGLSQGDETSLGSIAQGIAAGQLGQMISSSFGDAFNFGLTSMVGTPQASLVSDIISGAISGAGAGMLLPFPGGAALGAAIGAGIGFLSGGTKILSERDDAFKDYYGGLYQDVSARPDAMVESGSSIAGGREKDKISFTTLFKDKDVAEQYLSDLVDMANTTPFLYDDLTAMSKTLATYGYSAEKGDKYYILDTLQTIGDTGAALGMGTSDMTAVATALGQMKSSDKATREKLDILNNRGIGVYGYLADAKGVSIGDMYSMISKGSISGTEAVEIITAALKEAYSGSMITQSQTFEGISSTLEGWEQELENAAGEGYNTLRTEGKRETVDAYQGELGDALKEVNSIIGENRARKENLQAQYEREALGMVLKGDKGTLWNTYDEESQNGLLELSQKFAEWSQKYEESGRTDAEAGAQVEALYEEALAMGQSLFDNSEFMKILNDTEIDEVTAIRENTAGLTEATQAAYRLTQELSKGLGAAVISSGGWGGEAGTWDDESGVDTGEYFKHWVAEHPSGSVKSASRHAYGLRRVPFDDYPALLHEGERVLTKSEARAEETALGGGFPRLGYSPPVRDEYPPLSGAAGGRRSGAGGGEYLDTAPGADGPQGPQNGGGGAVNLSVTGNNFVGTGEEMADQLWEIIMRKLEVAWKAAGR